MISQQDAQELYLQLVELFNKPSYEYRLRSHAGYFERIMDGLERELLQISSNPNPMLNLPNIQAFILPEFPIELNNAHCQFISSEFRAIQGKLSELLARGANTAGPSEYVTKSITLKRQRNTRDSHDLVIQFEDCRDKQAYIRSLGGQDDEFFHEESPANGQPVFKTDINSSKLTLYTYKTRDNHFAVKFRTLAQRDQFERKLSREALMSMGWLRRHPHAAVSIFKLTGDLAFGNTFRLAISLPVIAYGTTPSAPAGTSQARVRQSSVASVASAADELEMGTLQTELSELGPATPSLSRPDFSSQTYPNHAGVGRWSSVPSRQLPVPSSLVRLSTATTARGSNLFSARSSNLNGLPAELSRWNTECVSCYQSLSNRFNNLPETQQKINFEKLYLCGISLELLETPVKIDAGSTATYSLNSLITISPDSSGLRKDPGAQDCKFSLKDLIAARDVQNGMVAALSLLEAIPEAAHQHAMGSG
jgi:hypothetical protein